ncbi:MAG: hypothetical protein EOM26_11410 [Alphaproteobacteria bacterium]|nr:hypothetical protein [Alphaproteobacteria bacterium]
MRQLLLGTFELAIFMDQGASRFPQERRLALQSLAIPFALLPLWVLPIHLKPTEKLGERSWGELIVLYGEVQLLFVACSLGLVWLLCHFMDRRGAFWAFMTAVNFLSFAGLAVTAPLMLMAVLEWHSWGDLYSVLVAAALYEFALFGFAAAYILNIPWQLAASIACFALVLHQLVSKTIFFIWEIG